MIYKWLCVTCGSTDFNELRPVDPHKRPWSYMFADKHQRDLYCGLSQWKRIEEVEVEPPNAPPETCEELGRRAAKRFALLEERVARLEDAPKPIVIPLGVEERRPLGQEPAHDGSATRRPWVLGKKSWDVTWTTSGGSHVRRFPTENQAKAFHEGLRTGVLEGVKIP